jgi:NOL1/NOP2/fmu family ribosome biogenesis protein
MEGKDNTSVTKITERTKPALATIGTRQVISTGRWNDGLMADWVILNAQKKWVGIGKLATVLGANTIDNKRRVRNRLSRLFQEFSRRGLWLAIVHNGKHNSASAVKVADLESEQDRQCVKAKLQRMKKAKELTAERYEEAMAVLHAMEAEQKPELKETEPA